MAVSIPTIPHGDDISVGTSAVLVYTAGDHASPGEPLNITIQNAHATAVVTVGGSDVADESNGYVLDAQYDAISVPLRFPGATVYAISDTASTPVKVLVA